MAPRSKGGDDDPMSLHDILVAWQAGRLSARMAMALGGLDGFDALYEAARNSAVPLRKTLLPEEVRAANYATGAVRRRLGMTRRDTGPV